MAALDQVLKVIFQGDARQLSGTLGRLQGEFRNFSASASRAFGGVQSAFAALGVTLTAGGLAFGFKKILDGFDDLSKASQRVGVSTEALSALGYAAQLSGASVEELQTGLKFLGKNLQDARDGSRDLRRSFEQLGVAAGDDVETALLRIADAFQKLPDGAQKTNLAIQIFGRSGTQLIPLLNAGASGLAEMRKEAERLGIVIDGKSAKAAELFNDSLERVGKSLTGVGVAIANNVLPTISRLAEAMGKAATEGKSFGAILEAFGRQTGSELFASFNGLQAVQSDIVRTTNALKALRDQRDAMVIRRFSDADLLGQDKKISDTKAQLDGLWDRYKRLTEEQGKLADAEANAGAAGKEAVRVNLDGSKAWQSAVAATGMEYKKLQEEIAAALRQANAIPLLKGKADEGTVLTINQLKDTARKALEQGDTKTAESMIRKAQAINQALLDAGKITKNYYQTQAEQLLGLAEQGQKIADGNPIELPVAIDPGQIGDEALIAWSAAQQAIDAKGPIIIPGVVQVAENSFTDEATRAQVMAPIPGKAAGGLIRGPGSGISDSIPVWLSAGEFVVKAQAVKNYGLGFLERLNSMALPRFAAGGPVGTPINIHLDGHQYPMTAAPSVAKELGRLLGVEVLKRGRR